MAPNCWGVFRKVVLPAFGNNPSGIPGFPTQYTCVWASMLTTIQFFLNNALPSLYNGGRTRHPGGADPEPPPQRREPGDQAALRPHGAHIVNIFWSGLHALVVEI